MANALDAILRGRGAESRSRTLVFLIDGTQSLAKAQFTAALRAAMSRNGERLTSTRIGVAAVGERGTWIERPTDDFAAVMKAVETTLSKPHNELRNVYADIRAVAASLKSKSDVTELALVALDNGDAEDSIEATVHALKERDIRFLVIASESYVSDSYWAARPNQRAPAKCT